MFTAFETELAPVAGVREALDAIALESCVASSGPTEKIRWTLGHTGLLERFVGRIFSATEVEHGKPAPDLFLHAAATLGWEPAGCAVVEDSRAGVQAALAAGMTPFGYAAVTPAAQLEGARLFTDMAELPALLQAPAGVDRASDSATQTGLSPPSCSKVSSSASCAPPWIGSTLATLAFMRTLPPTGSGAGKRTLLRP